MTNPITQDLGGVVRLLEEMTPGDLVVYDANEGDGWPPRPLWCFKNEAYDSGEDPALQGSIHYGERYLPRVMGWGASRNGRTMREAIDKYMKDAAMTGGLAD